MTTMQTPDVTEQLGAIQAQLAEISGELAIIRRTREEISDLKEDLNFVVKDLYQTTVLELEEVSPFVKTEEISLLFKRVLRNLSNFNEMLGQLESARDFIKDAEPLGKEVFQDGLQLLDDLDRKGYFAYARELRGIFDNVIEHFSVEDVHLLAQNVVTILETVKSLTQPEMLNAVNNAATIFKHLDPSDIEEYSIFRVMREANSKEMRRAMGLFFTFLKRISAQYEADAK